MLHPLPLRRGAKAPRLGWLCVLEDQGPVLAESRGPGRLAGPMSSKGRGCGLGTASFRARAVQNMTGCALLPGKHVYSCWLQTLHQVTQKLSPCPSQGPLLWRGGCTSARRSTGGPRCSIVCPSSSCLGLAPSPAGHGHPGPRLQTKTAFHVLGCPGGLALSSQSSPVLFLLKNALVLKQKGISAHTAAKKDSASVQTGMGAHLASSPGSRTLCSGARARP